MIYCKIIWKYDDISDDDDGECFEEINEREEDMNYVILKMFMMMIYDTKMKED